MRTAAVLWACAVLLAGCARPFPGHADPMVPSPGLRVATYNASLYSDEAGGLLRRLEAGDEGARKVAAVLQRVRPDVVLVNEFDFDPSGRAADAFQRAYLEVPQPGGGAALHYPYRYSAPVNTGVPSGLDLDRSGHVAASAVAGEDADAARQRGNDAWGYGLHPGQYGMLLLSMHPIDASAVRSFQYLRWSALPDAARPADPATGAWWHSDEVWAQLRLSSKSHWDVPVRTPLGVVHMLASHPTPPVFDGPEDRNGARNHDEIRFWREYIGDGERPWLCDDAGRCGGLRADARFVVLGDLNNDPVDGDGRHEAIVELIEHPRMLRMPTPRSEGAAHATGAERPGRRGDIAHATGDFGPRTGPLRLDYVLPSAGFRLRDAGVYWPAPGEEGADIVDGSDHRLVWVDLLD